MKNILLFCLILSIGMVGAYDVAFPTLDIVNPYTGDLQIAWWVDITNGLFDDGGILSINASWFNINYNDTALINAETNNRIGNDTLFNNSLTNQLDNETFNRQNNDTLLQTEIDAVNTSLIARYDDFNYNETIPSIDFTIATNNSLAAWIDTIYLRITDMFTKNEITSMIEGNFTALDNSKLDKTDQRYNNTNLIESVNTSLINRYDDFNYNQTYTDGTYNSTYDEFAYNQTTPANAFTVSTNNSLGSWVDTFFLKITDMFTKLEITTMIGGNFTALDNSKLDKTDQRYNDTSLIEAVNTSLILRYDDFNYNQTYTDGTYNVTYDTYAYNQTYTDGTYNSTYDAKVTDNSTWNQILADTLYSNIIWNYNQTYSGSTYNATYNIWSYNQTYSGSTYNATYDAKVTDNETFNQVLTDTLYTNKTYVDNQDVIYNNSAASYTDSKLTTTYYNATTIQLVTGTTQGAIGDLRSYNGISYNISEVASDFDLRVNFTGVTEFNQIIYRYKSEIGESHNFNTQIWDYTTSSWENYAIEGNHDAYGIFTYTIFDTEDHLSGGIVQLRFNTDNGNPPTTHKWQFDWIAISKGAATPSSSESDPFSIHSDGMVPLTGNWNAGLFNITADWFKGKVDISNLQNFNYNYNETVPANAYTNSVNNSLASWIDSVYLKITDMFTKSEITNMISGNATILDNKIDAVNTTANIEGLGFVTGGHSASTSKKGDGIFLTNDSSTIFFNGTKLNSTITQQGISDGFNIISNETDLVQSVNTTANIEGLGFVTGAHTTSNLSWNQTLADTLYRADDWNNFTGIPHATPSNGDVTHFSWADEIFDWVIGLNYLDTEVDPIFTAWDNFTGIPTASPSDGDTTHFSTADQIRDWVIGLNYGNFKFTNFQASFNSNYSAVIVNTFNSTYNKFAYNETIPANAYTDSGLAAQDACSEITGCVENAITSLAGDTSPQLSGYLDTNGQNIGSTSDEIENVYVSTNTRIYFGNGQEASIYYNGTTLVMEA